ncbi:MAG: AAA+ ATPase superfamily predicted ATPase [Cyclobacteriaceae bacterium]|jgi:AAA+ ATPase superfamily predicted ATPase
MESPFYFGQVVADSSFTNRTNELKLVTDLLISHNNAILISPRRYGKSSLVKKVLNGISSRKNFQVVSLDLTASRSEEAFLEDFANHVLRANTSKTVWQKLGDALKTITPSFSLGMGDFSDFATLSFNWQEKKKTIAEILNLPSLMAEITGKYQIIAIDEFQNINRFEDSEGLQYQMRSYWQHHTQVSYCLYGSKRHMMEEIFSSDSSPFYNFGQVLRLQKIDEYHWVPFIMNQFEISGKSISRHFAEVIVRIMNRHSEYVQFLSHQIWAACPKGEVSEKHMERGLKIFMDATSIHFVDMFDKLNNTQVKIIKAILNGETKLSSQEVIRKYSLGTSANVVKAARILIEEDIVEKGKEIYSLINPAFELWFRAKILGEPILDKFRKVLKS